jgi:aspartate aminotransferase
MMAAARGILEANKKAQWIRKMFEEGNVRRAKYGAENVFDFSLGNPNLEPPARFREIVAGLMADETPHLHAYMSNAGFMETREAVAAYLNTQNRTLFSAGDIVMTPGAASALNIVLKTIVNPGEEVIILTPYFVEYRFYLENHQAVPKLVQTKEDFSLDIDAIAAAINERTRAIMVNSPNNPTGKVYREEELRELARVLTDASARYGEPVYIVSDEPYRKLVYDNLEVPSIFDIYPESFAATSFSKDLSIPGERVGYATVHPDMAGKDDIMEGLNLCMRTLAFVSAPALMQRAIARLMDETVDISFYQRNRDMLYDGLTSCGYELVKPEGAFYLFPKSPLEDDTAFVAALQEENILTVPGMAFGGPGHFRIAYVVSHDTIEKALPGFERVMRKFRTQ